MLRPEHAAPVMGRDGGDVILGILAEPGGEERVGLQARVAVEPIAHKKGVAAL